MCMKEIDINAKDTSPYFTVAIPAYKSAFLKEAISSCLNQTFENFELVIVNDASPENLDSIVKSYCNGRIKYYKNQTNNGAINVVDTWNQCLNHASGQYLICMGDDDVLLPNCLQDYFSVINQYPSVDVFHTRTQIIDENNEIIAVQEERPLWESALTMLKERWDWRWRQFIGDFCFKVSSLKEHGGFYKLPLAWSSDDISAFRAALTSGIVNVQTFGFQYRDNPHTISNSTFFRLKAVANIQAMHWYQKTFCSLRFDRINDDLLSYLEKNVTEFHLVRVKQMMMYDLYDQIFHVFWWFRNRNLVNMKNEDILKNASICIKKKVKDVLKLGK